VIVIPIDDPTSTTRFTVEPFFQWHIAAAREAGDQVIVEIVHYADFSPNRWIGALPSGVETPHAPGSLARATIDRVKRTAILAPLSDISLEFPTVSARGHVLALAHSSVSPNGVFDRLVRIDMTSERAQDVELPDGHYPSEAIHVPHPGGGWLLSLVYDAASHASHVAVIDPTSLTIVARAWFDHHVPFTLHGTWQSTLP
jgi:all-trans-8'-apo-beta-carotenal 15,15'-oxygenase